MPPRHNRIQLNPLGLLSGTVGGNYEFRFDRHHALAIEGFYTIPLFGSKGNGLGGIYRYYYKQNTFLGIFFRSGFLSSKLTSPVRGDTTTYTLDLSYTTIGPNWGKAWYFKKRFLICYRIGIGYPIKQELAWKNDLAYPESPKLIETLYGISACMDSELTIGISF